MQYAALSCASACICGETGVSDILAAALDSRIDTKKLYFGNTMSNSQCQRLLLLTTSRCINLIGIKNCFLSKNSGKQIIWFTSVFEFGDVVKVSGAIFLSWFFFFFFFWQSQIGKNYFLKNKTPKISLHVPKNNRIGFALY